MESIHRTVLLNEAIESLNLSQGESIVIDGTFGGGGHSLEILKRYPKAKIIAIDQDKGVFEKALNKFKGFEDRIFFVNANFRDLGKEGSKDFAVLIPICHCNNLQLSVLVRHNNYSGTIFEH